MIVFADRDMDWVPGMTLAKLLDTVDGGDLYAVVRLDGKLVSRPDFETTTVPDGARIEPLPLIAGG